MAHRYKGPIGPLIHRCALPSCTVNGDDRVVHCSCLAVVYCSSKHRSLHRNKHRGLHAGILKGRARVESEKLRLKQTRPDSENETTTIWEEHHGNFLIVPATHRYLDAMYSLISEGYLRANTLQGVQWANLELDRLFHQCGNTLDDESGAHVGLPHDIPCVKLRLDNDRGCFDFITMWGRRFYDKWPGDYEPNPYDTVVDLMNNDVPEIHLSLLLLKLKLLIDIRNLRVTRKALLQTTLPADICRLIEIQAVRSQLSHQLLNDSAGDIAKKETGLLVDIHGLGALLDRFDPDITRGLLNPDKHLQWEGHTGYSQRIATMFQSIYPILWELEGGIDLMEKAHKLSALADLRDATAYPDPELSMADRYCTCRRLQLAKVPLSPGRLWKFIDYAVRDATFMGPFFRRPSQKLMGRYKPKRPKYAVVDLVAEEVLSLDSTIGCLGDALPKWKNLVGIEALTDQTSWNDCVSAL